MNTILFSAIQGLTHQAEQAGMPTTGFIDSYSLIMIAIVIVFVFSLTAQGKVKRTFRAYSKESAASGMTASQLANNVVWHNGLNVGVNSCPGELTDNFNPKTNVVSLSQPVYGSNSVAAVAVAAHELGHAMQYHEEYGPIRLRNTILPLARLGSTAGPWIIIIGLAMNVMGLALAGLILYAGMFIFQLVTLPVEFDASRRGLELLETEGVLSREQLPGAKKMLNAAAMTYVLAALASFLSLLRFAMIVMGRRRR